MKLHELDKIDKIILAELQRKAITPIADLADRAGFHHPPATAA
jgi:DNA-binding Lrp family transcriptional regulator